jgi:hypothetical protein
MAVAYRAKLRPAVRGRLRQAQPAALGWSFCFLEVREENELNLKKSIRNNSFFPG